MAEKQTIGNFFKFLRDKEDKEIPLRAMFTFTPNDIDWDGLGYSISDLDLIKKTDNLENIAWDKVDQSEFEVLNWVIKNSPENIELDKIDINRKGILALMAKFAPDDIPFDKVKVSGYVEAMNALRYGRDNINWSEQVDYTSFPAVKYLLQTAPEIVDKSKIDSSNEMMASLLSKYGK